MLLSRIGHKCSRVHVTKSCIHDVEFLFISAFFITRRRSHTYLYIPIYVRIYTETGYVNRHNLASIECSDLIWTALNDSSDKGKKKKAERLQILALLSHRKRERMCVLVLVCLQQVMSPSEYRDASHAQRTFSRNVS
jgi:hypothetical protein